MKESLQNIGNIFTEPSAAFSELKSEPRWGIAFVVFYLLAVLTGWAIMPYTEALIDAGLAENNLQGDQLEAAQRVTQVIKSLGVFFFPLFAVIGFIIYSAILRLAARFFVKNETLTFRHIYAAVIHISLINCIIQIVNALLLLIFRTPESVSSAIDLKMIPGLHLFFSSIENVKLLTFLSHINPLSLWVIAVLAIAVAEFTGAEKSRSRIIAVILWGLGILFEAFAAS